MQLSPDFDDAYAYTNKGVVFASKSTHGRLPQHYLLCGDLRSQLRLAGESAVAHVAPENAFRTIRLIPSFSTFVCGLLPEELFEG